MKRIGKFAAALVVMVAAIGIMGCKPAVDDTVKFKPGDTASTGIKIGDTSYTKTSEVVIIPSGTTGVVKMTDDSSWDTYISFSGSVDSKFKGVFIKNRKVTLSPFVMSQYEVTQELYKAVLSDDSDSKAEPSNFSASPADGETQNLRPVEKVNWYDAVYFCNKLSEKKNLTPYYTITDITRDSTDKYIKTATVTKSTAEGAEYGYRLPTEAEWEYAARGGNSQSAEWKNAFGKVTTKDNAKINNEGSELLEDENLKTVGWYYNNSSSKTHEVGLKEKSSLNLYDMQGNVWEWCWDLYDDITTDEVTDPVGAASGSKRSLRGGSWSGNASLCAVFHRGHNVPDNTDAFLGFRLCRSISK